LTEYSGRDLTHATDKPPAIAVLTDVFNAVLGDYLGGIWSIFPSGCLALEATSPWRKILIEYRAPSWSWASIDCRTKYPCDPEVKPAATKSWSDQNGVRLLEYKMVHGSMLPPL
ncbi:hypothetical protein EV127DRAFT_347533, partial [Xylaria flabelliformis]